MSLDKLAKIVAARTPGPLKAEKYPMSGLWAVYSLMEPMECRFDLLEDTSEGDAKFFAVMSSVADELMAVIKAAEFYAMIGAARDDAIVDDGEKARKAIASLKAKFEAIQ